MRTILLLGCGGQLGLESQRVLADLGTVVALDYPEVDFTRGGSLRDLVLRHNPAIVVNAAAYTAVDKAEADRERAELVNAIAPGILASAAQELGAVFVHYSTDYVFDGFKPAPYVETDFACPLSVYGQTKLEGELAAAHCRRYLVFRTSWVVSAHGVNFIKTILRLAAERDSLRVVADQVGTPTTAFFLADATRSVLAQMIDKPTEDDRWGIYHLVPSGTTTWNGFARRVIARAESRGVTLKVRADAVSEIATSEYPTPARRPANSRLDTTKFRTAFGLTPPDWTAGVDAVIDQIIEEMML